MVSHPCVVPVNQSVYVRLAELGWDPVVVVPDRWRHEYSPEAFAPRPLPGMEDRLMPLRIVLPGRPQRHFYLARPAHVVRRVRPRAVFLHEETFSVPALQWGLTIRRMGVPFGVQAYENLDRPLPWPARLIRRAVLARADFVAARSPAAGELARRWGAVGDVVLAPEGIPDWERPLRRPAGPYTIGFAGRLVPEKGIGDLVEAVRLLEGPVRLLLVGDGPLRAELEGTTLPNGTLEIRTGVSHESMAEVYAEMNALVLPSRTTPRWAEQFGRVLAEALWCGVPIVGSDSGEIPWVIDATRGGRLFPEGDVHALSQTLRELRADPVGSEALARQGREAVKRLFSVSAAAEALDEALLAALARRT